MKKRLNLHQQAADRTRAKILDAAKELFVKCGFSGTSMGALAKAASINQSLVYHYFESKEELWREVKTELISKTMGTENLQKAPIVETFDELFEHLVLHRFKIYCDNPDLIRMLMWQALEDEKANITGTSEGWTQSWIKIIESLQEKGIIGFQLTPREIMIYLNGIIWGPIIYDNLDILKKLDENYFLKLKMSIQTCLQPSK